MVLAPRIADIHPFRVMELLRRARELEAAGHDIIHMEVGEPEFPTPSPIVRACQRFLRAGVDMGYTPACGLPQLREAISTYYAKRFKAKVDPARIIITPGASGALTLAIAALTAPGDGWLIPDPGYPCNRHIVRAFEGQPQTLRTSKYHNFQPTADGITAAWQNNTRGVMLATPANPSGSVLEAHQLEALHHATKRRQGALIIDEIYQGLSYDSEPFSALSMFDDVFVINSFSKYFGMTGWRLGWMVAPEQYMPALEKLAQHFFICAPTPAQHAALAAFRPTARKILEQRRAELALRRNTLVRALDGSGFVIDNQPQGAFYIYANVEEHTGDSELFASHLLEEAHVAVTPGCDFGSNEAATRIRLSYTASTERLEEAVERIRKALSIR